jgi:hypothetical protein
MMKSQNTPRCRLLLAVNAACGQKSLVLSSRENEQLVSLISGAGMGSLRLQNCMDIP